MKMRLALSCMFLCLLGAPSCSDMAPDSADHEQWPDPEVEHEAGHWATGDPMAGDDPPQGLEIAPDLLAEGDDLAAPSPYEGWESWCMEVEDRPCDPSESSPCPKDRTGRPQVCVRPWWAKGDEARVCRPRRLSRAQRRRNRAALREIVRHLCRPGDGCSHKSLSRLLEIVALRESAFDNQVTHELNPDREANAASLTRALESGWYDGNQHLRDLSRWTVGYGWFGMNAPLFVREWDRYAPPEILCRQVESVEVYLRVARRAWRKLSKILPSEQEVALDNGERVMVRGVTWYDIHRAVSTGKLGRPDTISSRRFVRRARAVGLDPFATVKIEDLGRPIPKGRQGEVAEKIRSSVVSALSEG